MRIAPAILVTASLTCLPSTASAQNLPNGAAKEVVQTACSACHQLNVVTNAGHTPDEWNRIVGEMVMKGAAVPGGSDACADAISRLQFPAESATARRGPDRLGAGEFQGIADAVTRLPARSLCRGRWIALVTGQLGNVLGRARSQNRPVQGISAENSVLGTARPDRRPGRQYLVHRQFRGYIGKLDPKTGQITEYKIPGGARSAYADLRPGGHSLVHRAGRQSGRAARSGKPAK